MDQLTVISRCGLENRATDSQFCLAMCTGRPHLAEGGPVGHERKASQAWMEEELFVFFSGFLVSKKLTCFERQ